MARARAADPEGARERERVYWAANKERKAAKDRRWAQKNPEKRREIVRRWYALNPERGREHARNSTAAHDARKRDQFIEHVEASVVLARGGGICGICGTPVDLDDFHVDHVIPLAKGGEHSYANTQPAHPICNIRKGDRSRLGLPERSGEHDRGARVLGHRHLPLDSGS
jgi:5-methylcytosine-specific restriction endonuclease McrA